VQVLGADVGHVLLEHLEQLQAAFQQQADK